jgi:hypothetical protein
LGGEAAAIVIESATEAVDCEACGVVPVGEGSIGEWSCWRSGALNCSPLLPHSRGMKQQHEVMERPITLRLPSAIREKVEAEAAKDRRPLASLIRNVVEDWVERREAADVL